MDWTVSASTGCGGGGAAWTGLCRHLPAVEEVERRGLDCVGIYRLCGAAWTGLCRHLPAVEEVERRGLDCVGIYRLCCSSRRRRLLKADIDADAETAVLSADRVPDVNVVSCMYAL